MKTMPSAEFRRRYANVHEPIAVTVNGHIIGCWVPGAAEHPTIDDVERRGDEQRIMAQARFNSRGSRPVPKK